MLTEEDFAEAEKAVKAIDEAYNNSQLFALSVSAAEKTLYDFAKKVLAQSRKDFLTDTNPAHHHPEERIKNLELSIENHTAALAHLCKLLTWNIPSVITTNEVVRVLAIASGDK